MFPSIQHLAQLVPEVQHAGKDSDSERTGKEDCQGQPEHSLSFSTHPEGRGFESRQFTAASGAAQVSTGTLEHTRLMEGQHLAAVADPA